ncbi:NUDIX hydrolase [Merismopedia glauca]|uniref:NUDIX hydrolase n=1 Tax=Merismopedia glauca CCAP 1448/3 TaxID=1296344 RepID=A0A2T1C090_9CYAN|nr:NUDIX hydrolase [Merismopedia glauca]PSB01686.1 NUDIX hydrolase [Merismopedia glauca CCAP 1448/3]
MSHSPQIEVAIAILYTPQGFLMQLRDNIPGIIYPGCWGLFGGHLEPGETPESALIRELNEEIGYQPATYTKFNFYADERVLRHVFAAPLVVDIKQLNLQEGWDFGLLTVADIECGYCYSPVAQQVRPLGKVHQRIMLDFTERSPSIQT